MLACSLVVLAILLLGLGSHPRPAEAQITSTTIRKVTTSVAPTTQPPTTAKPTTTAVRSATTTRKGTSTTGKKATTTAVPTTLPAISTVASVTTTTIVLTFRKASYNPLGLLMTLAGFGLAGGLMAREWVRTRT
jgi:hypothetical protein